MKLIQSCLPCFSQLYIFFASSLYILIFLAYILTIDYHDNLTDHLLKRILRSTTYLLRSLSCVVSGKTLTIDVSIP